MARQERSWVLRVVGATLLAWAGFFVHNVAELPGQTILSPEWLLPSLIWLGAVALWLAPATRTAGARTLLAWVVINLVGGVFSVLPLQILPFDPAQTPQHYALHGLYEGSQLPLIVITAAWMRTAGKAGDKQRARRGITPIATFPGSIRRSTTTPETTTKHGSTSPIPDLQR